MIRRISLQRRLTLLLGGAILISGMLSALISFVLAYDDAKEFQDDTLRQIAFLTARDTETLPENKGLQNKHGEIPLDDAEARISVIHLPNDSRPAWLAENLSSGLHTLQIDGEQSRIFLRKNIGGKMTAVTQPTDIRNELAINSALRTFAPLVLFLPIMAWLIMRIVRHELAPIKNLAGYLDAQPTDQPRQLPDKNIPREIIPFVQAINRLLKRVTILMGQQRRFIADAAHELRTPLTALSIQVQNLRQAESLEGMRERIQPLHDGIERARKLMEQLLNLARIQAGAAETTSVDISAMARRLIAEYLPLAETKGIDLGLDEAAPLTLSGSPENFRLLLKNGLENALHYTQAGGEVTIRLLSSTNAGAGFEICDNGPGIPVSEQEHVFDPFYRLPHATGTGSGLGLTIAMEAATCQDGRLSLLSRPDGSGVVYRYLQG